MLKKLSAAAGALVALASLAYVPVAHAANDYRVIARGGANDAAQVKSVYRERLRGTTLVQRFNVEVEDYAANTTYEVRVNGALFGTITTDALGFAELEFKTFIVDNNPHDEEPPIPADFPHLTAGMTIQVGDVSATFR